MSSRVHVLPQHVAQKIAAGEVIERPASAVKELVENALDAGARSIVVEVRGGGLESIRVRDDGEGMSREDALLALQRHATSKLRDEADLECITTLGFRGEALPSLAAVSRLRVVTALRGAPAGTRLEVEAGEVVRVEDAPPLAGTTVEVRDLFFNTPARRKFMKRPSTELAHVSQAVVRQALAHPGVAFRLSSRRRTLMDLPAVSTFQERVAQILGPDVLRDFLAIALEAAEGLRVSGLVSRPLVTRASRDRQDVFVNRRYVRCPGVVQAVYRAYEGLLQKDRHPQFLLHVEVPPGEVDVNVHPAKLEVRFRDPHRVYGGIAAAVRSVLAADGEQRPRWHRTAASFPSAPPEEAFAAVPTDAAPGDLFRDAPGTYGAPAEPAAVPSPEAEARDLPLVPVAQIHRAYIVAESRDGLWLIDPHAAHERILYERLKAGLRGESVAVQPYLVPVLLRASPEDVLRVQAHREDFQRLGFEAEPFGEGWVRLRSAPALLQRRDPEPVFRALLAAFRESRPDADLAHVLDAAIASMACRPAVTFNQSLSREEMEALLRDLLATEMPYTCPHGRPTGVQWTLEALRRMFKR